MKMDGWTKMDNDHRKKMIAPIIITVIFVLVMVAYGFVLVSSLGTNPIVILLIFPLMALGIGMVNTLKSRIKEIRSGEEDDLSNY